MSRLPSFDPASRTSVLLGALVAYLIARIVLVALQPIPPAGFGHDSAYLWIVAQNLLQGRGFVNDAHWLVFLDPASLPVPYHNGGPLYPIVVAGAASLLGDLTLAGFLASAVAGAMLVVAVAAVVRQLGLEWSTALFLGFVAALFEPVLRPSFVFGTNALALLFMVASLAAAMSDRRGASVIAGVLLGLAWLTRSDAILMVPGLAAYLLLRDGIRSAAPTLAIIATAAFATISPWLIHTNAVWGSPLRSDSAYYLLQDWHAIQIRGIEVREYWHSPEAPVGLGAVISSDPMGFTLHVAKGIPRVLRSTLGYWAANRLDIALVFLVAGGLGLRRMWRQRRNELLALAVAGATYVPLFAIRPFSFETRYFGFLAALFALVIVVGFAGLAQMAWRSRAPKAALALVVVAGLACILGPSTAVVAGVLRTNEPLRAYQSFAESVSDANRSGAPVVVGNHPYHYTRTTGQPALSIPFSSDEYLLEYMEKYGATYVALTRNELEFWRPDWVHADRVPDTLQRVPDLSGFVYRRRGEP